MSISVLICQQWIKGSDFSSSSFKLGNLNFAGSLASTMCLWRGSLSKVFSVFWISWILVDFAVSTSSILFYSVAILSPTVWGLGDGGAGGDGGAAD